MRHVVHCEVRAVWAGQRRAEIPTPLHHKSWPFRDELLSEALELRHHLCIRAGSHAPHQKFERACRADVIAPCKAWACFCRRFVLYLAQLLQFQRTDSDDGFSFALLPPMLLTCTLGAPSCLAGAQCKQRALEFKFPSALGTLSPPGKLNSPKPRSCAIAAATHHLLHVAGVCT